MIRWLRALWDSVVSRTQWKVQSGWNSFICTDLTEADIREMRKQVDWCVEKGRAPIEGFIQQSAKGAYFMPVSPRCLPVKIEFRQMPPTVISREVNSEYSLEFGYTPPSKEQTNE